MSNRETFLMVGSLWQAQGRLWVVLGVGWFLMLVALG
jgi:hypothetical protein